MGLLVLVGFLLVIIGLLVLVVARLVQINVPIISLLSELSEDMDAGRVGAYRVVIDSGRTTRTGVPFYTIFVMPEKGVEVAPLRERYETISRRCRFRWLMSMDEMREV